MQPDEFDPTAVVLAYRDAIAQLNADPANTGLLHEVRRLRQLWMRWHGEDSLHEMCFGKPDDA